MYILFYQDGSIKKANLTDFIQKGNDCVNNIYLAIDGLSNEQWSGTVYCELPDGSIEGPITLTPDENGFVFEISSAITPYQGIVNFSLVAQDISQNTLFTFKTKLTINPSVNVPNLTKISQAQYSSLLQYIKSYKGIEYLEVSDNDYIDTIFNVVGEPCFIEDEADFIYFITSVNKEYRTANGYYFDDGAFGQCQIGWNEGDKWEDATITRSAITSPNPTVGGQVANKTYVDNKPVLYNHQIVLSSAVTGLTNPFYIISTRPTKYPLNTKDIGFDSDNILKAYDDNDFPIIFVGGSSSESSNSYDLLVWESGSFSFVYLTSVELSDDVVTPVENL